MNERPDYDLTRFLRAQEQDFSKALREIRQGRKESHWMWYIFPQLTALGRSDTARYYGISGLEEAKAYLSQPILRENLITISKALLELPKQAPDRIMGWPDDKKLRSSMTLFELADPGEPVFGAVLDKFYDGRRDGLTLKLLKR